jgi:hypothetical protein
MKRACTSICLLCIVLSAFSQNNRIEYNGQQLFLNGSNLAWVNFANDIGPGATDFTQFGKVFKETHDYGANSMRIWLHTNGTVTPEFNADTVVGPGEGAIADLKQILDSAYKYDVGVILCLWSFDMLRLDLGEPYLTRNRMLLEDAAALNSYIQYALIPMVDSTKNNPAIIAWEVFNEPEGMIVGIPDGGWADIGHVTRQQVQNVVNKIAGAIHRVDPDIKVTNGTHTLSSLSDRGVHNYYSDSALFNAGGDIDGYLDFYQVHFYDFDLNPFEHNYTYWNLDKPLIIGEFHPQCSTCGDFSNYEALIDSGYAGAMGWMWLDSYGESIKQELQYTFLHHTSDVDIDNNLGDTPYLLFTGPDYGEVFASGSDIQFHAEAYDTDGTIEKLEYFLDREFEEDTVLMTYTESPFDFTWEGPADGVYKVYVKVTDNDGYTKQSSPISFRVGNPPRYRYEAEQAVLTGDLSVVSDATASDGKYVDFKQDCSIKWTIPNCPADDSYDLIIGYGVPYGEKNNYIIINDDVTHQLDVHFAGEADGWYRDTVQADLLEGVNTVEIGYFWGWMRFDYIEFTFPRLPLVSEISLSTVSGNDYIDTPGGTLQMLATVLPENAEITAVEWSVSSSQLASVDQNGLLTAKKDGTVEVTASATDGSGVEGTMDITISNQPSGIPPFNFTDSKIFPNPATNELFFTNNDDVSAIYISNIQGVIVHTYTIGNQVNLINISDLEEGLYYISIQKNTGEKVNQTFIKLK